MDVFRMERMDMDLLNKKYRLYFQFILDTTQPRSGNLEEPNDVYLKRFFKTWKAERDVKHAKFDLLEKCIIAMYGSKDGYEIKDF